MYVGRFAPSPSGPLHAGSVVAALASYLDAKAAGGRWLVRVEDIDTPRVTVGADRVILQQLQALGMHWDGEVVYQSLRGNAYQKAFEKLQKIGRLYPCGCTRREIADSVLTQHGTFPAGERPYPGTCRDGLPRGKAAKAWRVRVEPGEITFEDRWCGRQTQDVAQQVGDFVVRRADGLWAYQLAVVVDDASQGVTDVVRGQDLLSSTGRQRALAGWLDLQSPRVMHVPLVLDRHGSKLSKQNGAPAIETTMPLNVLRSAWQTLGFEPLATESMVTFWNQAISAWSQRFPPDRADRSPSG